MKTLATTLTLLFALPAVAAEYRTKLDFSTLFPDMLEMSERIATQLEKKNGRNPLDAEALRKVRTRAVETVIAQRQNTFDYIYQYCDPELRQTCGNYYSFSAPIRECVSVYWRHYSPSCSNALSQGLGEVLAEDSLIEGIELPSNSRVIYDDNERIIGANRPFRSEHNGIIFKSGELRFQHGVVTFGKLAEDTVIHGILYKGLDKQGVYFHHNGNVRRGLLAEDTFYQGVILKSGSYIELHPNHYFKSGILAQPATIGANSYRANTYLYANEYGEVSDDAALLRHTNTYNRAR